LQRRGQLVALARHFGRQRFGGAEFALKIRAAAFERRDRGRLGGGSRFVRGGVFLSFGLERGRQGVALGGGLGGQRAGRAKLALELRVSTFERVDRGTMCIGRRRLRR